MLSAKGRLSCSSSLPAWNVEKGIVLTHIDIAAHSRLVNLMYCNVLGMQSNEQAGMSFFEQHNSL